MNQHASDLALERLLNHEPMPDLDGHLHGCDACWQRWQHLHADEGMTLPERQAQTTSAPANRPVWLPWTVAGVSAVVAMAATALLVAAPSVQNTEVDRLRDEVATLQLQLDEVASSERPDAVRPDRRAVQVPKERRTPTDARTYGEEGAHSIPPEVLEAAVQREIDKRVLQKLDSKRDAVQNKIFARIGKTIDGFVVDGLVKEAIAGDIEGLLQRELEDTWEIKAAVATGDLSEEDAWADWEALVEETDQALLRFLDQEVVDALRGELDGK